MSAKPGIDWVMHFKHMVQVVHFSSFGPSYSKWYVLKCLNFNSCIKLWGIWIDNISANGVKLSSQAFLWYAMDDCPIYKQSIHLNQSYTKCIEIFLDFLSYILQNKNHKIS